MNTSVRVPRALTTRTLARGVAQLTRVDPDLARIAATWGRPPLWARAPGFPTLVQIILEQQVSLASARAAYERLLVLTGELTPRSFLLVDDAALRWAGFSRHKTSYCRQLAEAVLTGEVNLSALARMTDEEVRTALTKIKGIGPWTAEVYLLMALLRPDAWPAGDLGLIVAVQRVKRLTTRPTPNELMTMSAQWRPLRAVAARLLWHYYLSVIAPPMRATSPR